MFIEAAINDIDARAGDARASYITIAPGQESAYLLKADEARRFLAATDPVDTDFPMLMFESMATGKDIREFAATVLSKADEWQYISGIIESRRMYWKSKIRSAENYDAVYMCYMTACKELEDLKCA